MSISSNRLALIAERAAAMPPRRRKCTYCRLVYRHFAGVVRRGRWYCDAACAERGNSKRAQASGLMLGALLGRPKP